MARVKAIINRGEGGTGSLGENNGKMTCGKITLDENAHTVTADGRDVTLSVKEFDLLAYFMRNKGIALSREKILSGTMIISVMPGL